MEMMVSNNTVEKAPFKKLYFGYIKKMGGTL
jgi:hypothetical protein